MARRGFWALKTGVVAAFSYCARAPGRRGDPAREPVAFVACAVAILGAVALGEPGRDGVDGAWLVAGEVDRAS